MSADLPAAFPRGKRKQPSPPASLASANKTGEEIQQPSKWKRVAPSSSAGAPARSHAANNAAAIAGGDPDFLFGNDEKLDATLHRKRARSHGHPGGALPLAISSSLPLGGGGVLPPAQTSGGRRVPPRIEALTFSKFARGTKVLGVVREVYDEYALVSLPTMLTGYVRRDVESDGPPLTRVLPPVNTIMAFFVLSVEKEEISRRQEREQQRQVGASGSVARKRRIELSPYPIHVNSGLRLDEYLSHSSSSKGNAENAPMVMRGRIASVEDHGCILDLGGALSNGRQAFLKFDNVEGEYEIEDDDDGGDRNGYDDEDDDANEGENQSGDLESTDVGGSDGGKRSLSKRRLNRHRVYDFAVLPSNLAPLGSADDAAMGALQMSLPLPPVLAGFRAAPGTMPTLSSLQPGMLTEVQVEAYAKNGLCVAFGDNSTGDSAVYRGSIDEDHLGGHRGVRLGKNKKSDEDGCDAAMWWRNVFKGNHSRFTARIIAVDAATRVVRFSLNPHILALNGELAEFPYPVGTIIKGAQVVRIDSGIGALLALPNEADDATEKSNNHPEGQEKMIMKLDKELSNNLLANAEYRVASRVRAAYVHISKSVDVDDKGSESGKKGGKRQGKSASNNNRRTPESLFTRHFSVSKRVPSLRILSTSNLFDGVASCATARSIVQAHVLTHADIVPAGVYKDVPVAQLLSSGGILVSLGCGVKGIVPAMHLFDRAGHGGMEAGGDGALGGYRQKVRLAKYKPGNLITVRCLTVDARMRQCVLTAKKTLVSTNLGNPGEADDVPIVDYCSIKEGQIAAGFLTKVDAMGLTVTFYNNVHGRVSSRSLANELGVEDPKLNYTLGDVVVARVVGCERRRNHYVNSNHSLGDDNDDEEEYHYRLRLSLKTVMDDKKEALDRKETEKTGEELVASSEEGKLKDRGLMVSLMAGSLLMPKRMKVLQMVDCLRREDGEFLLGYAVVAIKSKFFACLPSDAGDAVECKLPYDQLLDFYHSGNEKLSDLSMELDGIARRRLTVGKRVDAEGLVLSVPSNYGGGTEALPIVSLRPALIDTIKNQRECSGLANNGLSIVCPDLKTNLFMGLHVRGYVARLDERYGAFVRFLGGLTGLIPKLKKGCEQKLYDTIICTVTALDVTCFPPKLLLKKSSEKDIAKRRRNEEKKEGGEGGGGVWKGHDKTRLGDVMRRVKVVDVNFARAKVCLLDNACAGGVDSSKIRARIHVTMAAPLLNKTRLSQKEQSFREEHKIGRCHPFYNWRVGDVIDGARCVAVDMRDGVSYMELTNLSDDAIPGASDVEHPLPPPLLVRDPTLIPPGFILSAIVTSVSNASAHHGLWVQVCPGISGFLPALELSLDPGKLNNLVANYKVGSRITCCAMEKMENRNNQRKNVLRSRHLRTDDYHDGDNAGRGEHRNAIELSVLLLPSSGDDKGSNGNSNKKQEQPLSSVFKPTKPRPGDLVVGRIHSKSRSAGPPSLMLNLRGGYVGRCCITELADVEGWENMPMGKAITVPLFDGGKAGGLSQRIVSDSDADTSAHEHNRHDMSNTKNEVSGGDAQNDYPDGKYVKCRVLAKCITGSQSKGVVELSLRDSRLKGNLDDDPIPNLDEMAHAYVICTTKKGCFVRLSRSVEGRVILKELGDDFVPNPDAMFPPGRLVVGKVKSVKQSNNDKRKGTVPFTLVDMDLRESVLLAGSTRVVWDDVEENSKYTGVITRVETYGVFIRIENSDITGLAHVSECSDSYVKNLFDLYNPGDLVRAIVVKVDKEKKRVGFSLRPSNFADDSDESNDESVSSHSSSSAMEVDGDEGRMEHSLDSEDEDFVSMLKKKIKTVGEGMDISNEKSTDDNSASDGSSSDSESESSDGEDNESIDETKNWHEQGELDLWAMDTDVGFDWGNTSTLSQPAESVNLASDSSSDDELSSSSDESKADSDEIDTGFKSSHRSRKKVAAKRQEEEETSRREVALADGTADDKPETSSDFERLVASSPNSSEVWIRYMAFHLSLADIDGARNIASRAIARIEFRQEGEKLNVWTALLTLELKYGTDKCLHETVDRACQQNNPKQVYLRVCELLEKELDAAASASGSNDLDAATLRADQMFTKMCKKFKSKKSVWVAHFQYLLKASRHEEAHSVLKRSLLSLPAHKHVEVMSKFAQMEFELGSPERGRTIFNALLKKHPKRMDLLFVHVDKEVKNGDIAKARVLFDSFVNPKDDNRRKFKFSDKQMKSLFKKWYRMEEEHGNERSLEHVKEEARLFVAR